MGQYTSYWLYQKYETRDNQTIPVYPNYWSIDADGTLNKVIKIDNDPSCGYDPRPEVQYRWVNLDPTKDYYCDDCPEAQYRWVDMNPSTDYYCEGTTKYYKQKKQVSVDGGQTWEDVVPAEYQRGNVYETESTDCGYVPPEPIYRWVQTQNTICVGDSYPYETQYFTIVPKGNGNIKLSGAPLSFIYSYDSGLTWKWATSATNFTMTNGQKIMLAGSFSGGTAYQPGIGIFSANTQFEVEGNIMSLLFLNGFFNKTSLSGYGYTFKNLFSGCTGLTSIENLVLPATTLTGSCYSNMFSGCTSLTTVPSGLLPATTLANSCYSSMFRGCTSLTTAPILPATNMENYCYEYMFYGCTLLNNVTCLATNGPYDSTTSWVSGVASTGTFYKSPNISSWPRGTSGIPTGWTVVDYNP